MNELAVQQHVRIAAAKMGIELWRNNVGACVNQTGRIIRYGLANDSAQINAVIKSSDLIGITPMQAYVQDIGWRQIGVFTALEVKASDWKFSEKDDRAAAQLKFHQLVRQAGGLAGFVTCPDDIKKVISL